MLRECVFDFKGNLDDDPPMIELSNKNISHWCISMAILNHFMVGGVGLCLGGLKWVNLLFLVPR